MKKVLLVEDDPDLAELAVEILNHNKNNLKFEFTIVSSGEDALHYLNHESSRRLPHVMLLDLRLPGMSGLQVLERMKSNSDTKSIPVIIFSSTTDQNEIDRCYELNANTFILKAFDTVEVLGKFLQYWVSVARLPSRVMQ
jgi:two-component system response regulator